MLDLIVVFKELAYLNIFEIYLKDEVISYFLETGLIHTDFFLSSIRF